MIIIIVISIMIGAFLGIALMACLSMSKSELEQKEKNEDPIKTVLDDFDDSQMCGDDCEFFQDRSRLVKLNIAKKIKHTPDIEKMREFHKLGLGKGMGKRSIFWTCSNCESWVSLAHKYCSNCGAKFEAERILKEIDF